MSEKSVPCMRSASKNAAVSVVDQGIDGARFRYEAEVTPAPVSSSTVVLR